MGKRAIFINIPVGGMVASAKPSAKPVGKGRFLIGCVIHFKWILN